jgi:hypothetical protein
VFRVFATLFAAAVTTLALGSATNLPAPTAHALPAAPDDALRLRRFEWIPPIPNVRPRPVAFPEASPAAEITALATSPGRLWISARTWMDTNLPPRGGRLWSFNPAENRIEPVQGALAPHVVSGLVGRSSRLWLGLDGGVASLDAATFTVDPFGAPQGMTATSVAGLVENRRGLFALANSGSLFLLRKDGRGFAAVGGDGPPTPPGDPADWRQFQGSGDWLLAATELSLASRHMDAPRWGLIQEAIRPLAPDLATYSVTALAGSSEGIFWIGTDQGLYRLTAESGAVEPRERPTEITVPGGLGMATSTWIRPTTNAFAMARGRVAQGIRERMKLRAQYLRVSAEQQKSINPVTPRSRLPAGVQALHFDRGFLWVATGDPGYPLRSRIHLFHPGARKWVGWFAVPFPVNAMTSDDRLLWIGCDARRAGGATPLFAVDKLPLFAVPVARWTPDDISPTDLANRLGALPVSERAVFAFFSGDYPRVVDLLGGDPAKATDEALFLLAAAHEPVALDAPDKVSSYVTLLRDRFPDSAFTALADVLAPRNPIPATAEIQTPPPTAEPPATTTAKPSDASPTPAADDSIAAQFQRRDLNRDGRLSLIELRLWQGEKAVLTPHDSNHDGSLDVAETEAMLAKQRAK